jgi:hypothetical protein
MAHGSMAAGRRRLWRFGGLLGGSCGFSGPTRRMSVFHPQQTLGVLPLGG